MLLTLLNVKSTAHSILFPFQTNTNSGPINAITVHFGTTTQELELAKELQLGMAWSPETPDQGGYGGYGSSYYSTDTCCHGHCHGLFSDCQFVLDCRRQSRHYHQQCCWCNAATMVRRALIRWITRASSLPTLKSLTALISARTVAKRSESTASARDCGSLGITNTLSSGDGTAAAAAAAAGGSRIVGAEGRQFKGQTNVGGQLGRRRIHLRRPACEPNLHLDCCALRRRVGRRQKDFGESKLPISRQQLARRCVD